MQRLSGQFGVQRVSPLAGVAIALVLILAAVLVVAVVVVAIPLLIVTGLAIGGYRAVKSLTVRKTNELLNRDGAGRHNVRVLRSSPEEASRQS